MPDDVSPALGRSAPPNHSPPPDGSTGGPTGPAAGSSVSPNHPSLPDGPTGRPTGPAGTPSAPRRGLLASEDWWAIWLGGLLIAVAALGLLTGVAGLGRWTANPLDAFDGRVAGLAVLGLGLALLTALAAQAMGGRLIQHQAGFFGLFGLAVLSYFLANQTGIRAAGVGYAFWAILLGLVVSNTAGVPGWLRPALRSELYIKTGLVLLGAEILFNRILTLGPPGLLVAWLVTPVVILFMYRFGTRVLKMTSPSLVIVIAAATSVCGVSAAIATAAAARAKKDELTLAVSMTLIFTVLMMIVMPLGIRAVGMDPTVGAAWIGGTVDATGAVVAAGAMLGEEAGQVAAVVKMIQNILIGVVAFLVAVYWVTRMDAPDASGRPAAAQIWHPLPQVHPRLRRGVAALLVRAHAGPRRRGGGRRHRPHVRPPRLALLPRVREHRARVELPSPRGPGLGGAADSALRRRPDLQHRADPARGLARVRRGPLRAGVMMRGGATGRAPGTESVRGLAARSSRLAAGLLALGALALLLSQSGRLPGPAGDAIRGNEASDRDATALFYSEVDGWPAWSNDAPTR